MKKKPKNKFHTRRNCKRSPGPAPTEENTASPVNKNKAPNTPPPPPKEDPNAPLAVLARLRCGMEYLVEDLKSIDWSKESADHYCRAITEIHEACEALSAIISPERSPQ